MIEIVRAKLHGVRVTDANLEYQGSITLDPVWCDRVGIVPLEFVDIWNKYSGARIQTYVIYGTPGAGECVLNGSAARTCQPGDEVIVCARESIERSAIFEIKPKVLVFGPKNKITKQLTYDVTKGTERTHAFQIIEEPF